MLLQITLPLTAEGHSVVYMYHIFIHGVAHIHSLTDLSQLIGKEQRENEDQRVKMTLPAKLTLSIVPVGVVPIHTVE